MARKTKTPKNPNKRAERGTGSIRLKDNGKYEYRITYKDAYGNSRRKTFTSYYEEATIPDLVEAYYQRRLDMNYVQPQGYHRSMETLKIIRRKVVVPVEKKFNMI